MNPRRRGWIIAKATDARTTDEILFDFLDRVGRVVASRLGAGQPMTEAFDVRRWARELEGDLLDRPALASAVVERVARRLAPITSTTDLRSVLEELADKVARLAALVDSTAEEVSPHVLYRLSSTSGVLLYVGITDRGPKRWVEHARSKTWFGQVARFEIERFDSREDAAEAERLAIELGRPLYNVVHNRDRVAG